jgi:Spy/CpxP family protein refolding chaperone
MKQLQKVMSILVLALFMAVPMLQAQHHQHHRGHQGKDRVEMMKQHVDLTDQQIQEIEKIQEKAHTDLKVLHENEEMEREEKRTAARAIKEASKKAIDEVLTEEQRAELKKVHQQRRQQHKEMREKVDMKGFHQAMKDYRTQKMDPVLREQRAKLETKLASDEKATINKWRPVFKAKQQQGLEKMKGQKGKGPRAKGGERGHGEPSAEMKQAKEELRPIAEKYKEDIEQLMDEIADERAQWKNDHKAIHDSYFKEVKEEMAPHGKGHKHHQKGLHFLLMDPTTKTSAATAEEPGMSVYPNPISDRFTVTYETKSEGPVRIDLLDLKGNTIQTLVDKTQKAGTYTLDANTPNLKEKVYYLVLTTAEGKKSVQVFVSE